MSTHNQFDQVKKTTAAAKQQRSPSRAHLTRQTNPASIIQRVQAAPESLSAADVLQLQRTIGNRAVGQLMSEIGWVPPTNQQVPVQRQAPEEKELMQGKFASGLTGTLQTKEEAPPNRTRMPDHLKSGIENISGMDLSGVRVHYNSSKSKQLNALAYTQGQEIHVGSGQEKHLPHEGWHVVQQKQGRVKPTLHAKGVSINDNEALEHEADVMGAKVLSNTAQLQSSLVEKEQLQGKFKDQTIQRAKKDESGNFEGLDMATSSLVGVAHEETESFATVKSEAWMSSQTHSVVYEIKWDAAVAPGGNHLGQVMGQASDWVVDKSKDGVPIGDRKDKNAPYFNNDTNMNHAPETGRYFRFNDAIQQRRLRGGCWWFRLKVVDKHNNVLSQSHEVEVNWGE